MTPCPFSEVEKAAYSSCYLKYLLGLIGLQAFYQAFYQIFSDTFSPNILVKLLIGS